MLNRILQSAALLLSTACIPAYSPLGADHYCGDGHVNFDEECDDGNQSDEDACRNDCTRYVCGDGFVNSIDGAEECDDGNTLDADHCTSACTLPACGDGLISSGEECDDGAANADDASCLSGCVKATCGDGFTHGTAEQCDDGNTADGDECTSMCTTPVCGDGVVSLGEQCDEGSANAKTAACLTTCMFAACGDGFVNEGEEECDDGNDDDTDACLTTCKVATCGDGFVHAEFETCDDGINDASYNGCAPDCSALGPHCGDGVLQPAEEACDDGNTEAGDSCTNTCALARRLVFVTEATFPGSLGGISGADAKCNSAAAAASLSNYHPFKAWLASSASTQPAARMDTAFEGEYGLPDGTVVTIGWDGLATGTLNSPLNKSQYRALINASVWTNVSDSGYYYSAYHCGGWTSSSTELTGRTGWSSNTNSGWTASGSLYCDKLAHLYCFEDPA